MSHRFSHVRLFAAPWTPCNFARLLCPWDSPGKNTGVELPFPLPEDLPEPEIEPESPVSPVLQADSLPLTHRRSPNTFSEYDQKIMT